MFFINIKPLHLIVLFQWDDALDYLDPLKDPPIKLNLQKPRYLLLKHKYLELLCLKFTSDMNFSQNVKEENDGSYLNAGVEQVCSIYRSNIFYV